MSTANPSPPLDDQTVPPEANGHAEPAGNGKLHGRGKGPNGSGKPGGRKAKAPPRPRTAGPKTVNIPEELKDRPQWVVWRYAWRADKDGNDGKWTKVPYQVRKPGECAESNNPETWAPFPEAIEFYAKHQREYDGIGYVFAADDPYVGFDFDNCIVNGEVQEWVKPHLDPLTPTYAEFSPSGNGIKGIVRGSLPGSGTRKGGFGPDGTGAVEAYDRGRFFTITGRALDTDRLAIEDRSEQVQALYALIKPKGKARASKPPSDRPTLGPLSFDDQAIIDLCRKARNEPKFARLHDQGDVGGHPSASEADAALCSILAFYTRDAVQIERIVSRSALGTRDKWATREDYRAMTISYAIDVTTETYSPRVKVRLRVKGETVEVGGKAQAETNGNGQAEANGQPHGDDRDTITDEEAAEAAEDFARDQAKRPLPPFANFGEMEVDGSDGETKTVKFALRIDEMGFNLHDLVGNWPRRVDEELFWEAGDYRPLYLESSTRLFAWIDRRAQVDWTKGGKFIPQERFYEHLRMTAERYDAIEVMPHWPRLPGIYYMHRPPPGPSGKLEEFLDQFCPNTPADRQFLKAFILTLFWGGEPGARPAVLITGPDRDPHQGRGLGKTKAIDIITEGLVEGYVDVSPTDQIADVKTRLLSDSARQMRVVRIDNIKSLRFSWADLESLITSSEISGKALYKGEGRRPNTLICCITLNGASLSKDMAQRCIPIQLGRPKFASDWEDNVRKFARDHRWEIIGDIQEALETVTEDFSPVTRWAAWERDVLSKCLGWRALQPLIVSRQSTIDDDDEERDGVAEHFRRELRQRGHDPDGERILIPSQTAAEWLSVATRTGYATNKASTYIDGLGIPEMQRKRTTAWRGWLWSGKDSNPAAEPLDLKPDPSPHGSHRPQ